MKIDTLRNINIRKTLNSRFLWKFAVILVIFNGILVSSSRSMADPDLWGHVRFGLDALQNRTIPQVDPYSYLTEGQPWINHEWLAEILYALAWMSGGATGLVLLKTALWTLTYTILFWFVAKYPLVPLRAGILIFLSMTITIPFSITIRPHSFTALLYTLILILIVQAESGRYRWLWTCPLIFAIWPNLHGAFPAGLGILGVWALIHLMTHRHRRVLLQVVPPILVSGVATLLNPYGVDLILFILRNLNDPRLEISEWRPLQIHTLPGAMYLLWLALVILGLVFSRKPKKPALLLPLAITVYLPFISLRFGLFFILTALVMAGEHIGDAWDRIMPVPTSPPKRSPWLPIMAMVVALVLLVWKLPNFRSIPINNPTKYPLSSVELIHQSGVKGNLAVHFDWGDYAIWHLTPNIKVSIDTRREMAYSDQVYKENLSYILGVRNWAALVDDYPTDMTLMKRYTPTDNLMQQRTDWSLIYENEVSALYARQGTQQAELLRQAATGFLPRRDGTDFP